MIAVGTLDARCSDLVVEVTCALLLLTVSPSGKLVQVSALA
ncbi:hypothetical protein CP03DC29_0296 [Chlamydia psittaci 03DC29]|nr:hypothetical protein CP03DC29_0296 [Chlamydia psittaci 03DC29]EPP32297.1 hypothetical protein CPC197_0284 [Chlamydia psittaci C1/97]